ncbi:NAD(P)H-dependent oxidoreductase [Nostoc sp. WHI]|uniref:NAD(P)H-dependent oxidoreductase n=1 Tax=Nostoc sp. WHI TaxID=2650611 RepID=UPI002EDAA8E3
MTTFDHPPRILFLYGSLRQRSYSRLLAEEAGRIIEEFGAEAKFFDPLELPIYGSVPDTHPKVQELRELSLWSEGQVWSSPELHGQISGIMKNQIDWIPLTMGAMRPTQGRTLALMQVSGGSQSFNALNTVNYPNLPSTVEVGASVIIGECLNLDFRPRVGLTSPPTAETAEPSAFIILMPSALIFVAAFASLS